MQVFGAVLIVGVICVVSVEATVDRNIRKCFNKKSSGVDNADSSAENNQDGIEIKLETYANQW